MPGLFFYNYQHCNHSSLLRGKTYEGIKNGDLDLFASIHFPLAREDPRDVPFIVQPTEASIHFLLRGKTKNTSFLPEILNASIHFPLAREDPRVEQILTSIGRFNPLPSCEGRRSRSISQLEAFSLQSTSLLRGKTKQAADSIMKLRCFNPLPSCEGRRVTDTKFGIVALLQSTSLLRGKTL